MTPEVRPLPAMLTNLGWSWHLLGDKDTRHHLTPPTLRAKARAACGYPMFSGKFGRRRYLDPTDRAYCRECLAANGGVVREEL